MVEKIKTLCKKYEEIIVYLIVGVLNTIVSWAAWFLCAYTISGCAGSLAECGTQRYLLGSGCCVWLFYEPQVCVQEYGSADYEGISAVFRRKSFHLGVGCGDDGVVGQRV